jgi:hypothetical protein
MFITFWVDKFIILWYSKRPPHYDAQMPKQATNLLLWAGPLHLFSAMFMMSNTCTAPSEKLGGSLGNLATEASSTYSWNSTVDIDNATASFSTQEFGDRIARESSWFFFVALMVCVALLLSRLLLWTLADVTGLASLVKMLMQCCTCERSARISPEGEEGKEGKVRQVRIFQQDKDSTDPSWKDHINTVNPPASYKMAAHPDCANLVIAMSKQKSPDQILRATADVETPVEAPPPTFPPPESHGSTESKESDARPEPTDSPAPLQS